LSKSLVVTLTTGNSTKTAAFSLSAELHDRASSDPATVARLTALLRTVMDPDAIDARAKEVQLGLFKTYGAFGKPLNASNCGE
jgi:hypothetical protein